MRDALPYVDGTRINELISAPDVVELLATTLRSGAVDPESDSPRMFADAPGGEFIVMPTAMPQQSGVKLVSVAEHNAAAGLPTIQGVYVLFDSDTLAPVALLDAVELTLLRTPAVTTLAVRELVNAGTSAEVGRVAVLGTGPQAQRHIQFLRTTLDPTEIVVIGRRAEAAESLAQQCGTAETPVRVGDLDDLGGADVVVCVTSATTSLFDDALIGADTVVAAVGAHGADRYELPPNLVRRSDVAVEGRASAMREGGDLLAARDVAEWQDIDVANLADLVTGRNRRTSGCPAIFSGVGMAWEDLVVARELVRRASHTA